MHNTATTAVASCRLPIRSKATSRFFLKKTFLSLQLASYVGVSVNESDTANSGRIKNFECPLLSTCVAGTDRKKFVCGKWPNGMAHAMPKTGTSGIKISNGKSLSLNKEAA